MPTRNLNTNLKITSSIELEGILYDGNSSAGTSGQVLSSTSTGTDWVTLSEISGVDGSGTANYLSKWLDANTITNSLVYDNGTNVGIGTTNPLGLLMLRKDQTAPTRLIISNGATINASTSARLSFYEGLAEKNYIERRRDGTGDFAFVSPADDNPFVFENASGEFLTLVNSKVGIGTTSPNAKLHIGPDALVSGYTPDRSTLAISDTTNGGQLIIRGQSPRIWFDCTAGGNAELFLDSQQLNILSGAPTSIGSSRFYIKADGNVGIGTTGPANKLQVTGGSIGIDSQYMLRDNRNNTILLQSASTAASNRDLTIGNATYSKIIIPYGNVGIGILAPTFRLHVKSDDANDDIAYIHHDNPSQSSGTVLKVRSDAGDSSGYSLLDVSNNTGNALYVRGDRKVGIGTTSPATPLHVSGEVRVDATEGIAVRKIRSSYFSSGQNLDLVCGSGGSLILGDGTARLTIASDDSATFAGDITSGPSATSGGRFLSQAYSGSNRLGVFSSHYSSGNLLLGYGAEGKSGAVGYVSTYGNFSGGHNVLVIADSTLSWRADNSNSQTSVGSDLTLNEKFKVDRSGVLTMGDGFTSTKGNTAYTYSQVGHLPLAGGTMTGDLYLDDGSGSTPSLYFKNGANNFWRLLMESGGDFSVKEGTSTRLTFKAGGDVGIGTSAPTTALQIGGYGGTNSISFFNANQYIRADSGTNIEF